MSYPAISITLSVLVAVRLIQPEKTKQLTKPKSITGVAYPHIPAPAAAFQHLYKHNRIIQYFLKPCMIQQNSIAVTVRQLKNFFYKTSCILH